MALFIVFFLPKEFCCLLYVTCIFWARTKTDTPLMNEGIFKRTPQNELRPFYYYRTIVMLLANKLLLNY